MSHKVHPTSYRIRRIDDWASRGFYQKNFVNFLEEDFEIRKFLMKKLDKMGIERIIIERFPKKAKVIIHSSRPGLIIGRGGEGIERVKKALIKAIKKDKNNEISLEIKEVKNPWLSAPLSVDWAIQQLERRVKHKKVLKQMLEKIMSNKEVLGARVEVAGRLGGAEIARREWLQKGQLPRQKIRAILDYHKSFARTIYGAIGVKVWIYKGDKFE